MSGAAAVQIMDDGKSASAFRTISEVATYLEVPQHVLRFWESKFQQVRPMKRGGGRRYYRREDVVLLSNIKDLLYTQGLTIRGVQKLLKETGRAGGAIVRPSVIAAMAKDEEAEPTSGAQAYEQAPVVVSLQAKAETAALSFAARREVETVLSELKTMRDMLRQVGV